MSANHAGFFHHDPLFLPFHDKGRLPAGAVTDVTSNCNPDITAGDVNARSGTIREMNLKSPGPDRVPVSLRDATGPPYDAFFAVCN
jgi:hypothetical protein